MSDDEIEVLEVKDVSGKTARKWRVQNPLIRKGTKQDFMLSLRQKLNMEDEITIGKSRIGEPQILPPETVTAGTPSKSSSKSKPSTPPRAEQPNLPPVTLTPEQITDLTEGCLDSDNEPSSFEKQSGKSTAAPTNLKRARDTTQSFTSPSHTTVSPLIKKRASRFFGAGVSDVDVDGILASLAGNSKSPTPSPSPSSKRKKRLPMNSPIRRLPSHQRQQKSTSPGKQPVRRVLQLSDSSETENVQGTKEPYYYEAFCYIIKKVKLHQNMKHLFSDEELKQMSDFSESRPELQLYVRLMNRVDKWNRVRDIQYYDIAEDLIPLFDWLEEREYITCDLSQENLCDLLLILKLDDLRPLCNKFRVKVGKKSEMVKDLLHMSRTQQTLGSEHPLRKSICTALGRCVKLTLKWRKVFRRCILLFSMFHARDELDKMSSTQALLLLNVQQGKMIFPVDENSIRADALVFSHRDQLLRFEEALETKEQFYVAVEKKNWKHAEELSRKVLELFRSLLSLESEITNVTRLPVFLRHLCAGSVYARTLTLGADAMKQAKNIEFSEEILRTLLNQNIYCPHYHGRWILQLANLLHINRKNIEMAAEELIKGLGRKDFNAVEKMHLQQRAEKVIKQRKNGLSEALRKTLRVVMEEPVDLSVDSVEVPARAHPGSKPGLKKVYIRDSAEGSREFMSCEEIVIHHFRERGYRGIHDEGQTVRALCELALWGVIYDSSMPLAFQSPYQDRPLDWGTSLFYERRQNALEKRFSEMLSQTENVLAEELVGAYEKHQDIVSVIKWSCLERANIRELIRCVTVKVFVGICQRLTEDWKSHHTGFPDLLLWSSSENKCLFVEVKSPNDTLSTIQCMWLHFLNGLGAIAFVANVKETGSKTVPRKGR